ncbi:MAG: hypothetical protein IT293_07450 [Deltaproteobacteria bacterium]|nr:hypothetical protein [Deltaproteobacteria bacterium]
MSVHSRSAVLRRCAAPLLALALLAATPATPTFADRYDRGRYEDRRGYNDEYIFVATKTALDLDVHPVAKVPLVPFTLILDLVALPFEVIAGVF